MEDTNSKLSVKLDHLPLTIRLYWLLVSLEGLFVLTFLLSIPSETSISNLAGLSTERWLMVFGIGLISVVFLGLVLTSLISPNWLDRFSVVFRNMLTRRYITAGLYLISIGAIIGGVQFISLSLVITEPFTKAYMVRLSPLVVWAVLLGAQTLVFLPMTIGRINLSNLNVTIQRFLPLIIIYISIAFIWGFITLSRLGLDPSDTGSGWNALGTPILGWQVILAWVVSVITLGIGMVMVSHKGRISKMWRSLRVDIFVSVLLWVAAYTVWMAIPLTSSWFVEPPRQPNLEFYPSSDATIYDVPAQSALAGEGYQIRNTPLTIRPLYVFLLTVFHRLGGVGYEDIIGYQIALLALLPVGLYWLTCNLHNRITAIMVASLVVMREANAIALNNHITNSNAKLLMSDLPATMGVVGFTLILAYWFQQKERDLWLPLLAGGTLGATMLIRPEFGVLSLVVVVFAVLIFKRQWKYWLASSAALGVGIMLMISPWLVRNYQQMGVVSLHNPELRTKLVVQRYLQDSNNNIPDPGGQSGETPQVGTENSSDPNAESDQQQEPQLQPQPTQDLGKVSEFIVENPLTVMGFILNHFLNNQVQTVLYLPGTSRFISNLIAYTGHHDMDRFIDNCCGLVSYVRWLPYWRQWNGNLPRHALAPVLWNVIMIGIGIYTVWENKKWVGLLPLAVAFSHSAVNALVRNSGGRYVLPVDWIGMFYYSIGLIQVTLWTIAFIRNRQMKSIVLGKQKPEITEPLKRIKEVDIHWRDGAIAIGLLLFGLAIPLTENLVPKHYTDELLESRINYLMGTEQSALPAEMLEPVGTLLVNGGQIWQGRALYPRFNNAGVGSSGDTWLSLTPRDFARVGFILVSDQNHGVVFPQKQHPVSFPHGADVVIFGCFQDGMIYAWEVSVYDENGNLENNYLRDPLPEVIACSTP